MDELTRLINEAMDARNLGVNALKRSADRAELKLSSSTISLYRRGSFPKSIPEDTLQAFSQLLDIPVEKLYRAAYGNDGAAIVGERVTITDSLDRLNPRQQKLVRQLIHELSRTQEVPNDTNHETQSAYGLAAYNDPDPDIGPDAIADDT